MKDLKKIYPELVKKAEEDGYFYFGGYENLIDAFGHEVIVQVDDSDYQGDSRFLLKDSKGRIGHLIFGWGSCSGCDSLQACQNIAEVQELGEDLEKSIQWFDTPKEALKFFNDHDWEGDYSWHNGETKEYVNKVKEYLKELICS